jgi:hypothetical protein
MTKEQEKLREYLLTIKENKEAYDKSYGVTHNPDDRFYTPSLPAQDAVDLLCSHFLGEDWYEVDPLGSEQVNAIIVDEILQAYPNPVKKRKIIEKIQEALLLVLVVVLIGFALFMVAGKIFLI